MLDEQRQGHGPSPLLDAALSENELIEQQHEGDDLVDQNVHSHEFSTDQAYLLYASHSLSMWNSRMYEYGVVRPPIDDAL